ncbi:hypothetical protein [Nonomuraea sp. NPDC049480]|uniref:hypothetical protein n=1 Tax=Nonomuraea sp. NPDC049480 TaxID=3364353 RepID=UPI0037A0FACD
MVVFSAAVRSATDIRVLGWDRRDSNIPLVGHYDGRVWSIVPPGDALPPGRSLHYSPNGVTADASGLWITADASGL